MMKRIIYRVWDKGNHRMLYGQSFHANFYSEAELGKCVCGVNHSMNRTEPMLCTGIKDENNVLIFEGDIVELTLFDANDKDTQYKCEVKFEKGSFILACDELEDSYTTFIYIEQEQLKVIGNTILSPSTEEAKESE